MKRQLTFREGFARAHSQLLQVKLESTLNCFGPVWHLLLQEFGCCRRRIVELAMDNRKEYTRFHCNCNSVPYSIHRYNDRPHTVDAEL